jgi:two-component system sensor histidine kinase/response regulator
LPPALDGFDVDDGVRRVGGDRRLYRALLLEFLEHSAGAAAAIGAALAAGDRARARAEVHTLKGVAGTLSARELYAAAATLESALRRNGGSLEAEAAALAAAHARVMAALARLPHETPLAAEAALGSSRG